MKTYLFLFLCEFFKFYYFHKPIQMYVHDELEENKCTWLKINIWINGDFNFSQDKSSKERNLQNKNVQSKRMH